MVAGAPLSIARKFDFLDVGGSINEGAPGNTLADNEWQAILNYYQYGTRLVRRGGVQFETSAAPQQLTGVFVLNGPTLRTLLALGIDTIYRQDGTDLVALPYIDGTVMNSTTLPWCAVQYSNLAYLLRRDNMGLRRAGSDFVQQAGISALINAPVIADGGAGVMTAGDYTVVVTGYNTQTNNESNPSVVSNTLTLGASKKIAVSGIEPHPNPQVDAKRVYVTVPSQPGRWFFAGQIDNATTTFEINLAIQDYGRAASFRNGLPPPRLEAGDIWRERLFATDGVDAFWSQPGMIEAWDPIDTAPVFRNDGHRLLGCHAFGDRLMLPKTNKVHYFLSSEGSFSLHTLSDKHGCWSWSSMKSAEGNLFWYGGDNIYRSDGAVPYSITTIKVRNLLKRIPKTRREYVTGFVYPQLSWYALTIPVDESGVNRYLLIYNYKTDVWSTVDYFPLNEGGPASSTSRGPAWVLSDFDAGDEPALYAVFYDNRVTRLESGTDDDGAPFRCIAISKDHDFGAVGLVKFLQEVHLLTSQRPSFTRPGQVFQVGYILDGGDENTVAHTRIINLDSVRRWKRYNLSSVGKPAVTIALYLNYVGVEHLELDAYSLGVIVQARYPVAH